MTRQTISAVVSELREEPADPRAADQLHSIP
jgi:hypothetical protein